MSTKHTPAPWFNSGHSHDNRSYVVGPRGEFVAEVPMLSEGEANARLIAAAPDLLCELRLLRETISHYFRDFTHLHPAIASAIKDADRAIAKAVHS